MNSNPNRCSSRKKKQMNAITKTTPVAVLVTLGLALAVAGNLPAEDFLLEEDELWEIYANGMDPKVFRWKVTNIEDAQKEPDGMIFVSPGSTSKHPLKREDPRPPVAKGQFRPQGPTGMRFAFRSTSLGAPVSELVWIEEIR